MDAYVILRRNGWRTAEDLEERPPTRSIPRRSLDPQLRAGGAGRTPRHDLHLPGLQPGAVGRHAGAASLPADEIIKVADTVIVRPDPAAVAG